MTAIKKQINDFNLLTDIVGNHDNILLQRDNGTTFRTHISNIHLPWENITGKPLSNTSGASFIYLTRSELIDLYSTSGLIAGGYYMITDFKTCYDQPDYDFNGNATSSGIYKQAEVEPILVFAISENKLSDDAYQPKYPNDKIKYDLHWNKTEITGGIAYGRITERIDEYNNRTDYDHRTILFKRYRSYFYNLNSPFSGRINVSGATVVGTDTNFLDVLTAGTAGSVIYINGLLFRVVQITDNTNMVIEGHNLTNGSDLQYFSAYTNTDGDNDKCYEWKQNNIINDNYHREFTTFQIEREILENSVVTSINNYIGNHSNFYVTNLSTSEFLLANNVFGRYSYSNNIGDRSFNNTSYNWFNKNNIAGTFQKNVFKRGFYSNIIGQYFANNIINRESYSNKIGNEFYNNEFGNDFNNNKIGDDFNNNKMGGDFNNNKISNGFNNNVIGNSYNNNNIGNNFNSNKIYSDYYKNTTDNDFNNNNIHGSFFNNKIKEQFESNTLGDFSNMNDFNDNIISNRFKGNNILGQFASNIIGVDFFANTIIEGYNNNIGNFFTFNNIGQNFNANNIIGGSIGNTIGDNFQFNVIQYPLSNIDFTGATFVYGSYNCTIIRDFNNNLVLSYFDGTVNQYVAITA